jgi:AraC-like DNA-binding protein
METSEPLGTTAGVLRWMRIDDVDALRRNVVIADQEYRQLGRGAFTSALMAARFGAAEMFYGHLNRACLVRGEAAAGKMTVLFNAGAAGPMRSHGHDVPVGGAAVLHPDWGVQLSMAPVQRVVLLRVDLEYAATQAEHVFERDLSGWPSGPVLDVDSGVAEALQQLVHGLRYLLHAASPSLTTPAFYRDLEGQLMQHLILAGTSETTTRRQATRFVHASTLRRVEALFAETHGDRFRLADACRTLGISQRTLNRACHRLYGLSANALLRNMALNRVREALLEASPDEQTVTAVALAHGFNHLGRFARYYREQFGEPPSETLARSGTGERTLFLMEAPSGR